MKVNRLCDGGCHGCVESACKPSLICVTTHNTMCTRCPLHDQCETEKRIMNGNSDGENVPTIVDAQHRQMVECIHTIMHTGKYPTTLIRHDQKIAKEIREWKNVKECVDVANAVAEEMCEKCPECGECHREHTNAAGMLVCISEKIWKMMP